MPTGSGGYVLGIDGQAFVLGAQSATIADAPDLNPATAITLAAWYFSADYEGHGNDALIDKACPTHSAPFYQYHLGVTGNDYRTDHEPASFVFDLAVNGSNRSLVYNPWTPGRWYHVAGTYDGSMQKLYVNGQLVRSQPVTGSISVYGRPLTIGTNVNTGYYPSGLIDEARIYDRALSAEEIRVLSMNPSGVPLMEPAIVAACPGEQADFTVSAVANGPRTYQWQIEALPGEWHSLGDDASALPGGGFAFASPAGSPGASITVNGRTGIFRIRCLLTSSCGTEVSTPSQLFVAAADLGVQGGLTGSDGLYDNNDFIAFISLFFSHDARADLGKVGGSLGSDGAFDNNDFIVFIALFFAGC
ncbi:MAG: LamG domain-containing protein [Phycisphaerales bacterium]